MSELGGNSKYDDVLTSILVNEKSILGFLSAIFNFLARRTDFYYITEGPYESMGFPPGVAEELVLKVLRKCDPKIWSSGSNITADMDNEIMCSTVAQEVEVVAEENDPLPESVNTDSKRQQSSKINDDDRDIESKEDKSVFPEDYEPPYIPVQKHSESYNGAIREKYSWSQTITDLDVTVKLPRHIRSAKDLTVIINSGDITVGHGTYCIIKDCLPYKIKTIESFWSVSEGKLLIHLEKVKERWWKKLLVTEEAIDFSKIDCSRPLDELPEDHVAKVRELQWNQERKMKGLPTSDEMRNIEILKKAWNAEGSPFKGTEFNPNVLKK